MNPIDNNGINTRSLGGTKDAPVEKGGAAESSKRVSATGSAASTSDTEATGSESVSITDTAAGLLQLEARLKTVPDVDQPRVDAIKAAIEDGSYQLDADRIVSNLLRTDAELF